MFHSTDVMRMQRLLLTAIAASLLWAGLTLAAKPGGGGSGGTGGGAIYFNWSGVGTATMNSDGGGKTPLPAGVFGEPSRALQGGHRWFLRERDIPGETYPNGTNRVELFAIRDDGDETFTVQLTNDPDLEAFGSARWQPGDFGVSWVARRWDNLTGTVVDGGIYQAFLIYDADGNIAGLAAQPAAPLVPAIPIDNGDGTLRPDIRTHDWSPDGTQLVFDIFPGVALWIFDALVDPATGPHSTLLLQAGPNSWSNGPTWSPAGTTIAFNSAEGIDTISPNGSNHKTILKTVATSIVEDPHWSPTGTHLTYRYVNRRSWESDVYRAAADGSGRKNLTSEIDSAAPDAWR